MTDLLCWAIRTSGLVATTASILVGVSDLVLLASRRAEPGLGFDALQDVSSSRILCGGLMGAILLPAVALGDWHLYEELLPAGPWLSAPPALLLAYFFCAGSAGHISYAHIGLVIAELREGGETDAPEERKRLLARQRQLLVGIGGPAIASGVIGSAWLAAALLAGPTRYPRWFVLLNPLLVGPPLVFADKWLPGRAAVFAKAPWVHLTFAPIFAISTILLWSCR